MSGDLKERIERMLAGLGDTADVVADALREHEIFGARGDGCLCPISNLIRSEFPEAANDSDWGESAAWFVDVTYVQTPEGRVDLLDVAVPVSQFISVFDDGGDDGDRPYEDLDDLTGDL